MRIKSIHISAFGGLKNKTVDFSDGFNVIYGDNENGKTTVMSFIKMMFYGSGRNSRELSKNIRKKYTPWDGETMAGSVDFELDGKSYRLEREFRNSDSTDKATLCELDLGIRQAVSGDIGTKLFGIGPAAFERSVFVGQLGAVDKDEAAHGELNSRLSNIVTAGDESVSFETVNDRLQKAKLALMSKSGRAGKYDKEIKELSALKERLTEAERLRHDYEDFKAAERLIKSDIENKISRVAVLKEQISNEQDIRNADKLREMLSLKAELDRLNASMKLSDGSSIDESYVGKLNFCINKTDAAALKLNEKTAECERLKRTVKQAESSDFKAISEAACKSENEKKELEKRLAELKIRREHNESELNSLLSAENTASRARKKLNLPLLIPAIALLPSALVLYLLTGQALGIAAAVLAVIFAVLSFAIRPLDKTAIKSFENKLNSVKSENESLKNEESILIDSISELTSRLDEINTVLNTDTALLESRKRLLAECENEKQALEAELKAEQETLYGLFGRYGTARSVEEIKQELETVSAKAAKQKELKQQLNYVARDLGNISYDEAREKLSALSDKTELTADFDGLKHEYEALIAEISDKKARLAAAHDKAEASLKTADDPEMLKKEIADLEEKTKAEEMFCRAADVAMSALHDSFAELRKSYGSLLEKRAGEIFEGLTGGQYKSMQISREFDIWVEKTDAFGGKELDYLSSGTVDQAYLSLRLALSSLIFEENKTLPVLLDDALTQYDDNRAEAALKYLKQHAENGQIIMFTCHGSVYGAANNIGADCKKL